MGAGQKEEIFSPFNPPPFLLAQCPFSTSEKLNSHSRRIAVFRCTEKMLSKKTVDFLPEFLQPPGKGGKNQIIFKKLPLRFPH